MSALTVFVDVDTQVDFVDPRGALYVAGCETILPNIRALLEHASRFGITTISAMCAHVVNDAGFRQLAPHCIEGTPGHRRYFDDLPRLPRHVWPSSALITPRDLEVRVGHHYVVQKRTFPMFANPWMDALRRRGAIGEFDAVVFGVATDVSVRADVLDLCAAGARVRVVEDAIAGLEPGDAERSLGEMIGSGARLVATAEILRSVRGVPAPDRWC